MPCPKAISTGEVLWRGPERTGDNVASLSISNRVVVIRVKRTLRALRAARRCRLPPLRFFDPPLLDHCCNAFSNSRRKRSNASI